MATTIIKSANSDNQALVDSTGHLLVTGTVSATNPSVSGTSAPAPAFATQVGGVDGAGDLVAFKVDATGALVVSSTTTVITTNASVGLTGAAAPTSATEVGAVDAFGNLQHLLVDPAGKLLTDISGTATITGTVNASLLGLSSFQTSQYPISTVATQITPTPLVGRSAMNVKVVCSGASVVYVGNSAAVTASTGYPLFNGDTLQIDLTGSQQIWAIASSGTQTAYALEIG